MADPGHADDRQIGWRSGGVTLCERMANADAIAHCMRSRLIFRPARTARHDQHRCDLRRCDRARRPAASGALVGPTAAVVTAEHHLAFAGSMT
jgi:hypothetical protein